MLLRFAMLTLICTLAVGVFDFEDSLPMVPMATFWARGLVIPLAALSIVSIAAGTCHRREPIDDTTTCQERRE